MRTTAGWRFSQAFTAFAAFIATATHAQSGQGAWLGEVHQASCHIGVRHHSAAPVREKFLMGMHARAGAHAGVLDGVLAGRDAPHHPAPGRHAEPARGE